MTPTTVDVEALQRLEGDEATTANTCTLWTLFTCPEWTSTDTRA
ncbi:hypothetical protein ACFW1A_37780 [Kitasatospora sp. NPDC058965]